MARIFEDGELRAYAVNGDDLVPLPRNWPRLIHEGNWSAMIASSLNILTSLALLGLLSTGLLLWTRRKLRRPQGRASEISPPRLRKPGGPVVHQRIDGDRWASACRVWCAR